MSYRITSLRIAGVKGILDSAGDFTLKGSSIAVFAPNGCGKSGIADAVEYLFSVDGTVDHLGAGGADSERGGKHAIPHILAAEHGVDSTVSVTLRNIDTGASVTATRQVTTGRKDPLPPTLDSIIAAAPAHRILRQHDLRRFIVDHEPREKYAELSRWIGQERLEAILTHLTTAQRALDKHNPQTAIDERIRTLQTVSSGAISTSDEKVALAWCAQEATRFLEEPPEICTRRDLKTTIDKLTHKRNKVLLDSGQISKAQQTRIRADATLRELTSDDGIIQKAATTLEALESAYADEQFQLVQVADAILEPTWRSAVELLGSHDLKTCPICNSCWADTPAKTQEQACEELHRHLARLASFQQARARRETEHLRFKESLQNLIERHSHLRSDLNSLSVAEIPQEIETLETKLKLAQSSTDPSETLTSATMHLEQVRSVLVVKVSSALKQLPALPTIDATEDIDKAIQQLTLILETLDRISDLEREAEEHARVTEQFRRIAAVIQNRAGQVVNSVVTSLQRDVETIYKKIHRTTAVPKIHLVPDTNSKTLLFRVDFHEEGRTVPPAGYLSESQINTLGLALFLSATRMFNSRFPFIFLDDIVSSYDAEHRARIVDVVAEDLSDFQVFLTSHDELFYKMLRTRLQGRGWRFDRITSWSIDEGPKRETDVTRPQEIEDLILGSSPQLAGNGVRQFMEEWLDQMCERYMAYTPHKRGTREFQRTLFDYWEPFITRIKSLKGNFFSRIVESSPAYERLCNHGLLNYYSHAQSDPYSWPSKGDVEYVWQEFQDFVKLFNCQHCNKQLHFNYDTKRLYCTCQSA